MNLNTTSRYGLLLGIFLKKHLNRGDFPLRRVPEETRRQKSQQRLEMRMNTKKISGLNAQCAWYESTGDRVVSFLLLIDAKTSHLYR